jgi:uncharacterized membrane protein YebE (DUF533 family)
MADLPSAPPPPPLWPPVSAPRRPRRWPTVAWLVAITLVAGLAIVGWLRPLQGHKPPAAPTYTDQQVANAKTNVCAAFEKVQQAESSARSHAHVDSNGYAADLGAAALTQVALDAGSRYLLTKLDEEPATPLDLATAVRNEANAVQEALIGYINGLTTSAPELQSTLSASDEATATALRLCK